MRANFKLLKAKYNAIMLENGEDKLEAQGEDDDIKWTVKYPEMAARFISETASSLASSISGFDGFPTISVATFRHNFMTLFNVFNVFQRVNLVENAAWFADSIYYCLTGSNYFVKFSLLNQWKETTTKLATLLNSIEVQRTPATIIRRHLTNEFEKMKMIYVPLLDAFKKDANLYRTTYEHLKERAGPWMISTSGSGKRAHKPIAIRFEGEAGSGKSTAETAIHTHLFKEVLALVPDLPDGMIKDLLTDMADHPTVHSLSCVVPKPEFADGYAGQNFYSLQELGTLTDQTQVAEWMAHYFEVIDDQNLTLNTAFGDKGKRFFTTPVVTATTNGRLYTNNLADPNALFRRIEFDLETKRIKAKHGEMYDLNKHTMFKLSATNVQVLLSDNTPSRVLT